MKAMAALLMTLTVSSGVYAADLNETALQTLLSSSVGLVGEVHSYETVGSIYGDAVGVAKIKNECEAGIDSATCTLWINYELGETSMKYEVNAEGTKLLSTHIEVVRGD